MHAVHLADMRPYSTAGSVLRKVAWPGSGTTGPHAATREGQRHPGTRCGHTGRKMKIRSRLASGRGLPGASPFRSHFGSSSPPRALAASRNVRIVEPCLADNAVHDCPELLLPCMSCGKCAVGRLHRPAGQARLAGELDPRGRTVNRRVFWHRAEGDLACSAAASVAQLPIASGGAKASPAIA